MMTTAKVRVVRPGSGQEPDEEVHLPPHATTVGLLFFLSSLVVLFAATLFAYFWVRHLNAETWGNNTPGLPGGLWLSTGLLLASSVTMHATLRAARKPDPRLLRKMLWFTFALGCAFLLSQGIAWLEWVMAELPANTNRLYAFTFYMLTGVHAAHAVGGLVMLGWVLIRARRGAYTPFSYVGLKNAALYWHFLDGMWLVLFGVLLAGH